MEVTELKRVKKFKNKNVIFLLFSLCIITILMLSVSYAKFTTSLSISEKGKIITFPKGIYYYKEPGADIGYFYTDVSWADVMTSYSEETGKTEEISTLGKFLENINQKTNLYMVSTYTEVINDYEVLATFSEDIDVYGFNIEGKSYYETDTESNSGTLGYLFKIDTNPQFNEYETGNDDGYTGGNDDGYAGGNDDGYAGGDSVEEDYEYKILARYYIFNKVNSIN